MTTENAFALVGLLLLFISLTTCCVATLALMLSRRPGRRRTR